MDADVSLHIGGWGGWDVVEIYAKDLFITPSTVSA